MFTYRVFAEDGSELGEATYAEQINEGETVVLSGDRAVQVLDVLETPDSEEYAGLLHVQPA